MDVIEEKNIFCQRVRIRGSGAASGSVPKCHGSGTLVKSNYYLMICFYLFSGGEFEPGLHHRPTSIDIQVNELYFSLRNSSLVPQIKKITFFRYKRTLPVNIFAIC
jgi:hypothetical protein